MSFYSGLAKTASRLLTEKGESTTFTRTATGTFDPATGSSTGDTVSTFTAKAYPSTFDFNQVNGTSVLVGDKKLIMEAGNKPAINDVVTLSDGDMKVINYNTLGLTNDVVAYVVQLRA